MASPRLQGLHARQGGGGTPLTTIKMERDTTVYALWVYTESDGVATAKN